MIPLLFGRRRKGSSAAAAPILLWQVNFDVDDAAPLDDPYVGENGSVTGDAEAQLDVTAGLLNAVAWNGYLQGTTAGYALGTTGLAFFCKYTTASGDGEEMGWFNSGASSRYLTIAPRVSGASRMEVGGSPARNINLQLMAGAVEYDLAFVMMAAGGHILIKGGAFTNWTRLWMAYRPDILPVTVFAGMRNGFGNCSTRNWRLYQFTGAWATDGGYATHYAATAVAATTGTQAADAHHIVGWTVTALDVFEYSFRRTDDDNRWIWRCDQAGATGKLIERNAGAETERSSTALTWTAGTTYIFDLLMVGNEIRIGRMNTSLYSSAVSNAFNNTATGTKVSHAVTNWIVFPNTHTGAAATALDTVVAATS